MKSKMRITLLGKNLETVSDRLVDQYTELLSGPTDKHDGPIRLEFNLIDKPTIEKIKEYIDKLSGILPLPEAKVRGAKPTTKVNPYREIFEEIKGKTHIEDIIEYLDKVNFRWLSGQLIAELEGSKLLPEGFSLPIDKKYQYLVRVLRFAKDPANDKYDFTLMVGIKFIGEINDKVKVYHKGELKATLKREWKKKGQINLKEKKVPMTFPDYMTIEERKHWRYINRKIEFKRPISAKEDKFYNRYKLDIKNLNEGKPGFNL